MARKRRNNWKKLTIDDLKKLRGGLQDQGGGAIMGEKQARNVKEDSGERVGVEPALPPAPPPGPIV